MTPRQLFLVGGAVVVALIVWMTVRGNATPDPEAPPATSAPAGSSLDAVMATWPEGGVLGRTEEGARLAALSYATASQEWLYLTDEEIDAAVRTVASPGAADRLAAEVVAEVGVAREALAASPGRVWWLVRPLAWRIGSFTPDSARVSVWTVAVLSAADVAVPQADWLTVTVDLMWTDDGWRVEEVADAAGPTPIVGTRDQPWQPEPFDEALEGFSRLGGEDFAVGLR